MSRGDWIQTYGGGMYFPAWPSFEDVHLTDIAHALSNLCRFGGHCKRFYSVAEHSVWVSYLVPREHALQALMHDATEAYCVDVPRPLKVQLPNYKEIEERNWYAICIALDIEIEMHPSVKEADNRILLAEQRDLMGPAPASWFLEGQGLETPDIKILGLCPEDAKKLFLNRYKELM